jgi:hypothetical protein
VRCAKNHGKYLEMRRSPSWCLVSCCKGGLYEEFSNESENQNNAKLYQGLLQAATVTVTVTVTMAVTVTVTVTVTVNVTASPSPLVQLCHAAQA